MLGVHEGPDHSFAPVGVVDATGLIEDFWAAVRDPEKVSRDVTLPDGARAVSRGGMEFVVVTVPRAERDEKPVSVYERRARSFVAYVRRGAGDRRATDADIRLMSRDAEPAADRAPLERFGLDALCPETLGRYRGAFRMAKGSSPWTGDGDEDFLFHIGAASKGRDGLMHPTEAGLLAFGHEYEITSWQPRFLLDYRAELSGGRRWDDRVVSQSGDWSGNVYDFYLEVTRRLHARLGAPFTADAAGTRHGYRNPVTESANEAVVNALAHAWYGGSATVRVILRPDALEVTNTGSFLLDREVAVAGGFSECRNPTLMRILSFVGASDRAGSGLSQMWSTWEEEFGAEPVLAEEHSPASVRLELPMPSRGLLRRADDEGLNGDQSIALDALRGSPAGLTSDGLAEISGKSRRSAQRTLKALLDRGLVDRERRGGKWVYSAR